MANVTVQKENCNSCISILARVIVNTNSRFEKFNVHNFKVWTTKKKDCLFRKYPENEILDNRLRVVGIWH